MQYGSDAQAQNVQIKKNQQKQITNNKNTENQKIQKSKSKTNNHSRAS
jgi:hypothetical protein